MAIKNKVTPSEVDNELKNSIKSRVLNRLEEVFGKEAKSLNKSLRNVFQNLSINYLNNYEQVERSFNDAARKLKLNDANLYDLLEEANNAIKDKDITKRKSVDKQIQELLKQHFPAGIKVKGKKIESAAGLLALQKILKQEKGGNFDQFGAIRQIIGEGKDTQKGHSNASIILLSIEGALASPEISRYPDTVRDLERLRVAARVIDRVEETELQQAFNKLGITGVRAKKSQFLDVMDELLTGVPEVGVELFTARDVFASLASGSVETKLLVDIQEDAKFNERKGALSAIIGSLFADILKNKGITEQIGKDLFSKVDAAEITSSPSMYKLINNIIINSILGKKYKYKSKSKKYKKAYKLKVGSISKGYKRKRLERVPKRGRARTKSLLPVERDALDLLNLKKLINEMLAKNIEQDMDGAGGKLNYQTGRFADSAHLLTLTRNQAGVLAGTYTYMRDPYDVFLPGHKMGTPKRDPRIYVEGAAREAAMTILKNKFPGIALNLQ